LLLLGPDDTEVIRYLITIDVPFSGHLLTQKGEDRRFEIGECLVTSIVRDMLVHQAPKPLDRVQMRAIRRNEVELDPAPRYDLGFAYVIRLRGNIHVTDASGEMRTAANCVGRSGRARKLPDARVTASHAYQVGAVVCACTCTRH
jgi:hypothetical protein